jgi:hypothetical protein
MRQPPIPTQDALSADGVRPPAPVIVGLVDGSVPATTRRFQVVLADDAVVQLDDLVALHQTLPDGRDLAHYGIVVEGSGHIEGAEMPSDTRRITEAKTMPGITSRRVEIHVLRTFPELWLPPAPGAPVTKAVGADRSRALFLDQMDQPLAVGLDQGGDPIAIDFAFLNGEKGGHVSISGISGVATKTTYALFLLYMLFETQQGRAMLGPRAPQTRALVFSVKGEDLLHLDRANAKFPTRPGAAEQWAALGVEDPGPFTDVELYAPRAAETRDGSALPPTSLSSAGHPPTSSGRDCCASASPRTRTPIPRWASLSSECGCSSLDGCGPWKASPERWSCVNLTRTPHPCSRGCSS